MQDHYIQTYLEKIDWSKLSRDYRKFPIKKLDKRGKIEVIPEQDLKYLYLELNFSRNIINQVLNVSGSALEKFYKKYNIKKSKEKEKEAKETLFKIQYGSLENYNKLQKDKRIKTLQKKYGVTNPTQIKEIKEKAKQTMLNKYGKDWAKKEGEIKEKARNTCLEKYGVEHPSKTKEFQDKIRNTCLEKYGVKNYNNREKAKQTMLNKYGVSHNSHNIQTIEKRKITYAKHLEDPEFKVNIRKKIENTSLEKYGVTHFMKSEKVKNNLKQSLLKALGVDNASKSPQVKEKRKKTMMERYGSDYYSQCNEYKERKEEILEKIRKSCLEHYGVQYFCISPKMKNYQQITCSKINREIAKYLEIPLEDLEFPLSNRSFDMKKNKYLIEIDPYITHNTIFNPFCKDQNLLKQKETYHLEKTLLAKNYDYQCIHIWDWDSIDKIKEIIMENKLKIYARKCEIKEISKKEVDEFLIKYHLQNSCKNQKIRLGLFYDNTLVQVMTFGKPRYNKKYEWELLRLCTKENIKIIGGVEKLFKYFLKVYNPKNIISYCDFSKFSGNVYIKLGFKNSTKKLLPSKHWWNPKTKRHITDNELRKLGFSRLHNDPEFKIYAKGLNNENLMLENGYFPIYDCGQLTFTYNGNYDKEYK